MTPLDVQVLLWLNQGLTHPLLDLLALWLAQVGGFSVPLFLGVLGWMMHRQGRRGLVLGGVLLALVGLGDALGGQIKSQWGQPRPCSRHAADAPWVRQPAHLGAPHCGEARNGMPSNHTLNFFTLAAFMGMVFPGWRVRGGFLALALLMGLSRVYLGVHYPSQVVA
ncbi:MAG: phosphatase PAP2 family protein, partial [Magnetococcus sp. WYHC-3]